MKLVADANSSKVNPVKVILADHHAALKPPQQKYLAKRFSLLIDGKLKSQPAPAPSPMFAGNSHGNNAQVFVPHFTTLSGAGMGQNKARKKQNSKDQNRDSQS